MPVFQDRSEAGRRLAAALWEYRAQPQTVVFGIPRGGVVVAAEVARALELPLEIAAAAKVSAPGSPEYAIGAVAPDGVVSANPGAGYSLEEVARLAGAAREKVAHEIAWFHEGRTTIDPSGVTALLVDDGLATGLTATVAADWLARSGAGGVVVAVPVAPPGAVRAMRERADEVVVLEQPATFMAVGQHYEKFGQTEDTAVAELLREAAARVAGPSTRTMP